MWLGIGMKDQRQKKHCCAVLEEMGWYSVFSGSKILKLLLVVFWSTEQISNIVDQVLEELRSKVQDSDYTTSTLQNKMDEIEEVKQELSDDTD